MSAPEETGEAMDARARVVARARSFLGPQDPEQFFRTFAPMYVGQNLGRKKSWCGIFTGAVLVLEELWPLNAPRWEDGKGYVLKAVADGRMRVTRFPLPGDVACFGPPLWHYAIVSGPMVGGKVPTIDGNVSGPWVEGVAERVHPVTGQTTFYSIAPLISEP